MTMDEILRLPEGPARTAALAAWVQGLFEGQDRVPVLVGGAAVELYTAGAYVTGDLDFVGTVTPAVAGKLQRAGFIRSGRHWISEVGEVFLEFPGESLAPDERSTWLETEGHRIRVVAIEDLLVDRLGGWQHWRSAADGVNAFLLWRACREQIDRERLNQRAVAAGWERALAALAAFAARVEGREPLPEELERWAMEGP